MAENESGAEKTEEPTAKRRSKFREEGQIAVSRDAASVMVLATMLLVLIMLGGQTFTRLSIATRGALERVAEIDAEESGATLLDALVDGFGSALTATALICGAALIVGVAVGLFQTGGNFSSKAIGFRWDRVSLLAGIRRTLFSAEALVQLGLSLAKAVVLGTALWIVLAEAMPGIVQLGRVGLEPGLAWLGGVLFRLMCTALIASAAIAALDFVLTHRRMEERMKMTRQEVKDEHKQQEGDPFVRGRMRARMRELGRNRMLAATREADVVVVNPTHYACALAYRRGQVGAPRLLAKGKDALAQKIRDVARSHQIPIIANPPAARAIYAGARVGREIPDELFDVVARVLAYLYRMLDRRARA